MSPCVFEQVPDGRLVGDVGLGLPHAGYGGPASCQWAAPSGENLGAQRRHRPHGGEAYSAGAADDHNALILEAAHGEISSTASPRTRRAIRAAAASPTLCHGPRQPIWGSSAAAGKEIDQHS